MQLQKEKGWGEDEMALSASQIVQRTKKGSYPRKTPRFKEDVTIVVSGA